jgi:hypothetical protein
MNRMIERTFIKANPGEDLTSFFANVCRLCALENAQMRESSNYAGGEYGMGSKAGVVVRVMEADDAEFTDCRFELSFAPARGGAEDAPLAGVSDSVGRTLALAGYVVIRPREGTPRKRVRLVVTKAGTDVEIVEGD